MILREKGLQELGQVLAEAAEAGGVAGETKLTPRVLWVGEGEKMPWALWGADRGFFEKEWAHRRPYLRAVASAQ